MRAGLQRPGLGLTYHFTKGHLGFESRGSQICIPSGKIGLQDLETVSAVPIALEFHVLEDKET